MQIRYARLRISKLYYNPRGRGILPIGMVQLFLKKKDLFSTGLKETKDLVDMYTDDKLSVTRIPMKKLYTEELDKETMENIERQFKYNGFEIEIKQEYYISFINYYM